MKNRKESVFVTLAQLARTSGIPVKTLIDVAARKGVQIEQPMENGGRRYVARADIPRLLGRADIVLEELHS